MKRFAIFAVAGALAASFSLAGCDKDSEPVTPADQKGEFDIEFENLVGTAPLVLATQEYATPAGDQFKVTTFRYYVSNIKLTRADGTEYVQPESYYLIDAAQEDSRHLTIKDVPTGDYTGLKFTIGVDSARNVAGAQTGALDPAKGMFWTWNSGYIYTKLEGSSPQSTATNRLLTFHIGGFKSPNNTIRTVSPSFNGAKLPVRTDHTPEVHYDVNVLKMFSGPTTVRFASLPTTMGGPNSVLVANNYAQGMFSVKHIHAN